MLIFSRTEIVVLTRPEMLIFGMSAKPIYCISLSDRALYLEMKFHLIDDLILISFIEITRNLFALSQIN